MPIDAVLRYWRKAAPVCERTVRRWIQSGRLPIIGVRRNPRGKGTPLVSCSAVGALLQYDGRPRWVDFRFACEQQGCDAAQTLRMLLKGCWPDIDCFSAAMRLILWQELPFLHYLHRSGDFSGRDYPFHRTLAASIRKKAGKQRAGGDVKALWEKGRRELREWVIRATIPVVFTVIENNVATHEIIMAPAYCHEYPDNKWFRDLKDVPGWARASIEPISRYTTALGSAALPMIHDMLFNRGDEALEAVNKALAVAAQWKPVGDFHMDEARAAMRPGVDILAAWGVPPSKAFKFLMAISRRRVRRRRKISVATVNRAFGIAVNRLEVDKRSRRSKQPAKSKPPSRRSKRAA